MTGFFLVCASMVEMFVYLGGILRHGRILATVFRRVGSAIYRLCRGTEAEFLKVAAARFFR